MRLGIDFGTTRTIVAHPDRGNFPVVHFENTTGDMVDHVPSVAAVVDGRLVHGFDAVRAAGTGAPLLRSFKRVLAGPAVTAATPVKLPSATAGPVSVGIGDLLTGFLGSLRRTLAESSTIAGELPDGPISCVIGVPANATGAQRLITLDSFHAAGFEVIGILNEPSAAGLEFSHRQQRTLNSRRTKVVVYDLGGGTFDASLVNVDGTSHDVEASTGINHLGGDDFDEVLARLATDRAGVDLSSAESAGLHEDARIAKEQLSPQSRRISLDVAGRPTTVTVDDFYVAALPLVTRSIEAMAPLVASLDGAGLAESEIAGLHLVGGASSLP